MILNLRRSDDLSVEDMMKRSFAEFHLLKQAPERERMISKLNEELDQSEELDCERCLDDVEGYYNNCKELAILSKALQVRYTWSSVLFSCFSPSMQLSCSL